MKKYILLFFWMVLVSLATAAFRSEGKTGLSFLKIGVDARAVGMGEAYTAITADASATYWNPAGLVSARRSNVLFNHNQWIQGIKGEFAALSLRRGKTAWAVHVRSFNISDIPVRVIPSENPVEETSAHYLSAGISYSRQLNSQINFGVTAKYLFEKIFTESASGVALDIGFIYHSPFPNLKMGAVIQNMGRMGKFRNERTRLPMVTRLGVVYRIYPLQGVIANLALDFVKPLEENIRLHMGSEFILWKQLVLRAGFQDGYEARGYTAGVGIRRSAIRLDYAIIPFSEDLGVTHRFSVNFVL